MIWRSEFINRRGPTEPAGQPAYCVIAMGETHSVREFCEIMFEATGFNWEEYVKVDPMFLRPAEVDALRGDSSKARKALDGKEIKIGNLSTTYTISMEREAISFNTPRTMQVYLNGEKVHEQYIDTGYDSRTKTNYFTNVEVPLRLNNGENTIIIRSVEGSQRPCDIPVLGSRDQRELSFALRNVTIVRQ